jgi:hypothetical protein
LLFLKQAAQDIGQQRRLLPQVLLHLLQTVLQTSKTPAVERTG